MAHAHLLEGFIDTELGKANAGTNDINRGQCTGLVALWLAACMKPPIFADGKDMLTNASPTAYHIEVNTPINYPISGDVVAWNANFGAGHGHTAIVLAANVGGVVVFEQNNPDGAPPLVTTHDYTDVLGWLSWK
jgi:CHAP domain